MRTNSNRYVGSAEIALGSQEQYGRRREYKAHLSQIAPKLNAAVLWRLHCLATKVTKLLGSTADNGPYHAWNIPTVLYIFLFKVKIRTLMYGVAANEECVAN